MASNLIILCVLLFLISLTKGDNTIKRLQGCHIGSKVQGLHDVKLYLAQYGYLNYQNPNSAKSDEFDQELEVAVKEYQNFYHLNVTGTLDAPTISTMLKPRCGQPDIVTNQTTLPHGVVSHYQFFPNNPRWRKSRLTYAFGSNFPINYVDPVVRALNRWAFETGRYFSFARVYTYPNSDLKISWEMGDHGDGSVFVNGVLAHAYSPPDGRFHYNANQNWAIGAKASAFDVETVALHEIGHLLGLGHSQYQNAIMWSMISSGTVKGLNSDDIQGIKALYGI
ncbi:hypothetical protein QVD17_09723 [Tagetes erecta]|uniref:Peptidase metallopeptidase domain-containing protein n=1 Tax=Tagetes erecta TaxID=13708 RepID=A0AAD8L6I1_TARER|nr:hypothetical protein QVD17_09723 [Tagetes erecta]